VSAYGNPLMPYNMNCGIGDMNAIVAVGLEVVSIDEERSKIKSDYTNMISVNYRGGGFLCKYP